VRNRERNAGRVKGKKEGQQLSFSPFTLLPLTLYLLSLLPQHPAAVNLSSTAVVQIKLDPASNWV
jgi:hypothetical protein